MRMEKGWEEIGTTRIPSLSDTLNWLHLSSHALIQSPLY